MKKSTSINASHSSLGISGDENQRIVVRNVQLSEDNKQRVVFRARPLKNRVTCRTKGNPTIYVFPDGKGFMAMTKLGEGSYAMSPDKAFAKTANVFWS